MASMDYENENGTRYEGSPITYSLSLNLRNAGPTDTMLTQPRRVDEAPRYERDRSASPRPTRRNESPRDRPRRSASPNGNGHVDNRLVQIALRLDTA